MTIVGYRLKATRDNGEVYYVYPSIKEDIPWPADRRDYADAAAALCNEEWNPHVTYEVEEVTG